MFALRKFETACDALSFQEYRDLAWAAANPDICFNVSKCMVIDGPLDEATLEAAIAQLACRHEALRTQFVPTGEGAYRRVIHAEPAVPLTTQSFPHLAAADPDIAPIVRDFIERRFECGSYPLFRVMKLSVQGGRTLLALSMAHVVSDAASTDVLFADLGKLYEALAAGTQSPLAPLDFTLSDFVQSHRAWMESDECQAKLNALCKKLQPGLEDVEDDLAGCGVAQQKARKACLVRNQMPASLTASLEQIARDLSVTPPAVLLAVASLAYARLLGKKRFFVSFMMSNRHYVGMASVVGHVANAVPLLIDTHQGTVRDFITAINKEFYLAASGVGVIPLGVVNHAVAGLDAVLSVKSPLNQFMINISGPSGPAASFAGMPMRAYANPYAGFISNALQMNFGYAGDTLIQQCRCPEDDAEHLAARAAQSLIEAVTACSERSGCPLSDF